MTGLALYTTPGPGYWDADFTGLGLIQLWGPGGPGGGGSALNRGGGGGGGGAKSSLYFYFTSGVRYYFTIGAGTAGGAYGGGVGVKGSPSIWGGGDQLLAAAGDPGQLTVVAPGGSDSDSVGDVRSSGGNGDFKNPAGSNPYEGAPGGAGGGENGGAGGINNTQNVGNTTAAPVAPGGGGSGGGQLAGGVGGASANGGIIIAEVDEDIRPGYKYIGVDANYVYASASDTNTFQFQEDGRATVECSGAGGGSRGGNGFNGGHGGGGGAFAASIVDLYKDVFYSIHRGTAGTSSTYGGGGSSTTAGQASYFMPSPVRLKAKQIVGGVGTLWTAHSTTDTFKRHGFEVGQSVTIASLDANFNGVRTVYAVDTARGTISFLMGGSVAYTTFTATGVLGLTSTYLIYAAGGARATAVGSGGTRAAGGFASDSIGQIKYDGEYGTAPPATSSVNGGDGGSGGGPVDGLGGLGAGSDFNPIPGNDGQPGLAPGGAGGGGKGISGGDAGASAQGAVAIRYVKSYFQVKPPGTDVQQISRLTMKHPSLGIIRLEPSIIRPASGGGKTRVSPARMRQSPESLLREYPDWVPEGQEAYFNRAVGAFNLRQGAARSLAAVQANDFRFCVFGDSVSEGWTSYNILTFSGTQDFPKAFPRLARDYMATGVGGSVGGSGLIIPVRDTAWVRTGSGWTNGKHFLHSNNTGSIITLTTYNSGNAVEIVHSGGSFSVKIDGVSKTATGTTAGDSTLHRATYTGLSLGTHVIEIRPAAAVRSNLFGAGVYNSTTPGIICDNLSQGGATAAFDTGDSPPQQAVWSDVTAAPAGMLKTWTKFDEIYGSGNHPDACVIFLGGNDSANKIGATAIRDAFEVIGDTVQAASPDMEIIMMPDCWTEDRDAALMDLAFEKNWAIIDVFWLTKRLRSIFGGNYNGDVFGHLNAVTGAQWMGHFLSEALLTD